MTKAEIKKLQKELVYKSALVWDRLKPDEKKETEKLANDYKSFLDTAKTERESVKEIIKRARKRGFRQVSKGTSPTRAYASFMDKAVALAVPGKKPLTDGVRLIVSHIDAPRLDLKLHPLYEEIELAMLKTHYYGGIKKYQWMSRPLALHGRVIKADGKAIDLVFGEDENGPVLTISDLLPHLAAKVQAEKKVSEAFPAEKLNLLLSTLPLGDADVKERFKLAALNILNKQWGITEEDFISAEIEVVPAGKARDVGLDSSLIGAYGQDDRFCAYTSMDALFQTKNPSFTSIGLFLDKEEIGSEGATGAKSQFLESFLADLFKASGQIPTSDAIRTCLINTKALSADGTGALDPDYQEVHEKRNAARIGYGPCITKYTGSRGKYDASDASAEFTGWLRSVFNKNNIVWQAGELGKVDQGGGGTVAKFYAEKGMNIIDCGPALLDVHSPFELCSKADVFMVRQAYKAFYQAK